MRSQPTDQILAALQQTVATALKQWLDDNKNEVLLAVREAVRESEMAVKRENERDAVAKQYYTVADVARRWQLHPESIRRMMRQGRLPRTIVGRRSLLARGAVEAFEKDGTIPSRLS